MRNLDNFTAMSMDGQRNALIEYFKRWANIEDANIFDYVAEIDEFCGASTRRGEFLQWNENRIEGLVDGLLDWLYRQAE